VYMYILFTLSFLSYTEQLTDDSHQPQNYRNLKITLTAWKTLSLLTFVYCSCIVYRCQFLVRTVVYSLFYSYMPSWCWINI